MAGLLKPNAAYDLVSALKETVSIPIHPAHTRYEWKWYINVYEGN